MKFLYIELKGYNRLALNNINLIKLNMDEAIQIILGRNGCGKSSLLRELSPLPPDKEHFTKDGYKIQTFKHGQDTYTLTSRFSPVTKHSFIKNNELELNEGGTAAVQKDLVKKIFGITPEFINVAMGLEAFTAMPPSRRRELFTQMCDTDYSYAIGVYTRAKENLRDVTGSIKLTKKRLSQEVANLVSDDEYVGLKKHLDELTCRSKELYQNKITKIPNREDALREATLVVTNVQKLSAVYWNARKSIVDNSTWSPSEIMGEISEQNNGLNKEKALLSILSEDYNVQKQKIDNNEYLDDEELSLLRNKVIALTDDNKMLLQGIKSSIVATNPTEARIALEVVKERLKDLLMALPVNDDNWFSIEKLDDESNRLSVLKANHSKSLKIMEGLNSVIEHYNHLLKEDAAECPECKHVYRFGYDAVKHNAITKKRDDGLIHVARLEEDIKKSESILKDLSNYQQTLINIKNIVKELPVLECIWNTMFDANTLKSSPAIIAYKLDVFENDLKIMCAVNSNNVELNNIRLRINSANAVVEKDIRNEKDKLNAIENSIGACTSRISSLNKAIGYNLNYIKQVELAEKMGTTMRGIKAELDNCFVNLNSAVLNDLIDCLLKDTHIEIANVSMRVNDMSTKRALVEDLKNQIIVLEKEENALNLLLKVFSPTDGIIAEGLLGFIRSFVKAMNATIGLIWTYNLKILDCSTEEHSADLNYKFPIEVDGDVNKRNDVKDGSSAMREIINLAYRLVAMVHMGLGDYPLMIDEFGSFFDAEHKNKAPHAIKNIYEQMNFEQIFIISHHQLEYTMFPSAQFCVLDKNNIVIPSSMVYNKHVVIE